MYRFAYFYSAQMSVILSLLVPLSLIFDRPHPPGWQVAFDCFLLAASYGAWAWVCVTEGRFFVCERFNWRQSRFS
jgi:hypothetical protein